MTAVSDETGRGWLPLKYEDGPDFCTVTFATGAAFALTVHPERMKLMEAALSASPVAQEPVATKATQQASADFLHEEMIKLGSPLTYTACLTLTKRITDTNTLAWAGEVNKLCTEIGSLKNEIAALKSAANPPATPAGLGADEIARIIATKCFDPRVIDSSGKPFWKKSQWSEAQKAATAILALLSRDKLQS